MYFSVIYSIWAVYSETRPRRPFGVIFFSLFCCYNYSLFDIEGNEPNFHGFGLFSDIKIMKITPATTTTTTTVPTE